MWGLRDRITELEAEVKELKKLLAKALAENARLEDKLDAAYDELAGEDL